MGDGAAPRFRDDPTGLVTLHSRENLAALAATASCADLSERRFRSNIAIDGAAAWEEQSWVGRTIRIGEVVFEVVKPKTRCLATHANPLTGERDVEVMKILPSAFQAQRPTFAIGMTPAGCGTIRIGDEVTLRAGNSHRQGS